MDVADGQWPKVPHLLVRASLQKDGGQGCRVHQGLRDPEARQQVANRIPAGIDADNPPRVKQWQNVKAFWVKLAPLDD